MSGHGCSGMGTATGAHAPRHSAAPIRIARAFTRRIVASGSAAGNHTREYRGLASGLAEEPLDDHAVAPLPGELGVARVHPHGAEAGALVQGEARGVLGIDARDELPEAARLADPAQ